MSSYDFSVETPLASLTACISPSEEFFVRHHWPAAAPDPDEWSLTVEGGGPPAVWDPGVVGNGRWTGVRVRGWHSVEITVEQ